MDGVPLSTFFEARPQVATAGYRKGWEKLYGKRAQQRREKEAEARRKEVERKAKKEKQQDNKRRKEQAKQNEREQQQKIKAIEREKAERKNNALKRRAMAKKRQEPPRPPGLNTIPAQIAHCMMAVHKKRGKSKEAAWNICRWAMTKYGYLKGPYRMNSKLPKATKQTPKGVRRSFQHGMEKHPLGGGLPGTGVSKYNRFIKMFKDVENDFLLKKDQK